MDTKSVKEISFPAVSVCHPVSWTWPSITNLFSDLDVRGSIITSLLAQDPDLLRGGLSTRQESTNCTFDLEEIASFSDLIQNEFPTELGYMNHFFMYFGQSTADAREIIAELNIQYLKFMLQKLVNQSITFDIPSPCQWQYNDVFCSGDYRSWIEEWTTLVQHSDESLDKSNRFCNINYGTNMTSEWCSKCWQSNETDCIDLGQVPFYQRKYLQRYLRQMCTFSRSKFETIQLYDLYMTNHAVTNSKDALIELNRLVEEFTGLDVLQLWYNLNKPFLPSDFKDNYNISEFKTYQNLPQEVLKSFEAPKIHGNVEKEFVLIPLCNFGSPYLKPCTMFKKTKSFYSNGNLCYTFNFDGKVHGGQSISPIEGLNFVVNMRLPGDRELKPPLIVIHPNQIQPDLNIFPASTLRIKARTYMSIGIQVNIYNVSQSFVNLGDKVTKCHYEPNYSEINCQMRQKINGAQEVCQCSPWYLKINGTSGCISDKLKCFNNYITDQSNQSGDDQKCPKSCVYTEYSVSSKVDNLQDYGTFDMIKDSYGDIFSAYVSESNPMLFADKTTWMQYEKIMKRSALINVNFEKGHALVTTKDAKVTFADMLGTIGGTFGVFLGLSFVGILDFIILTFRFFKK